MANGPVFGGLPGGVYEVCRLLNFCLNPRSLSMGKVCPRSHISSSFEILSLWLSGAVCISSFMSVGSTSVTFWTPEAYVPSAALGDTVWPACLDFSIHCLVTESKTYSTPSLWVTGLFLNCWKIFWTMMESDCEFLTQSAVMVSILVFVTPGGFSACSDCSKPSNSSIADMTTYNVYQDRNPTSEAEMLSRVCAGALAK